VVAVGEMPLFHTRLTHTLKVQQLSRRIAEHMVRNPSNRDVLKALGGLDVSAAEAAGLAHDLGHPPFGHVGEAELSKLCKAAGLDGFEGNAQTFRILTKIARHGEETDFGLALSDKTLAGVIKYPWLRTGEYETSSKWNAYPTEKAIFEQVRKRLATGHRSVEAAIMDWADDITYALHDLEDFIRAGRVPIVTLATDPFEFERFTTRAVERLSKSAKLSDVNWEVAVARFEDLLETFFAQFSLHTGTADDLASLRSAFRQLINQYVSAAALVDGPEPLEVTPLVRGEIELFKQLTWHYVINEPSLAALQVGHAKVIKRLFRALTTWLAKDETHRLPRRLVDLYEVTRTEPGSDAYSGNQVARQARAVADYIASLTESQAVDLHERLSGIGTHSVTDPWLAY
jgi:dGTPase